jgi:hypothetical protein
MTTTVRAKKAELIHIEVDRRLGHEWDEWNGKPLPNAGNYAAPALRFIPDLGRLCPERHAPKTRLPSRLLGSRGT